MKSQKLQTGIIFMLALATMFQLGTTEEISTIDVGLQQRGSERLRNGVNNANENWIKRNQARRESGLQDNLPADQQGSFIEDELNAVTGGQNVDQGLVSPRIRGLSHRHRRGNYYQPMPYQYAYVVPVAYSYPQTYSYPQVYGYSGNYGSVGSYGYGAGNYGYGNSGYGYGNSGYGYGGGRGRHGYY